MAATLAINKTIVNVAFPVALLLAVAVYISQPHRLREAWSNPVVVACAAFFTFHALSLAWTILPMPGALKQLSSYRVLLLPLILLPVLVDPIWRRRVGIAVLSGLALTLVLSLVQSVIPLPFAKATQQGYGTTNAYIWSDHTRQNTHMTVLFLWALGSFLLVRQATAVRRGWLVVLLVAVTIDILVLVLGRTGYLTVTAATLVVLRERFSGRAFFAGLVASVMAVGLVALSVPKVNERMTAVAEETLDYLAVKRPLGCAWKCCQAA
jgi:O-antigen ligase